MTDLRYGERLDPEIPAVLERTPRFDLDDMPAARELEGLTIGGTAAGGMGRLRRPAGEWGRCSGAG